MMLRNLKNNQKGAALAVVLMVLMVISILAVPFIMVSGQEQKNAIRQEQSAKAYYIALAGAEAVAHRIANDPTKAALMSASGKSKKTSFGGGSFEVNVTNSSGQVNVVSEGTYGTHKKTITILMTASSAEGIFHNSIFSYSSLTLGAMKKVTGPLESKGTINTDGLKDRGVNPVIKINSDREFIDPDFPETDVSPVRGDISGTAKISESGTYDRIELGNQTLTFDTSMKDLKIVVGTFITKGDIVITGPHRLELFVKTSFDTQTKSDVNPTDPAKLLVFLQSDCNFQLKTGNSSFYGYIFGPFANVTQIAGAGVKGAMVVGSFTGESSSTVEFVPFADTYDISPIVLSYSIDSYH